jgi:hypothetical protein
MLIALADMAGKQTPPGDRFAAFARFADELLENYFTGYCRRSDEPPLITGRDLISVLGLPPSPIFGKILAGIEAERLQGEIETRQAALERARQLAATWDKG